MMTLWSWLWATTLAARVLHAPNAGQELLLLLLSSLVSPGLVVLMVWIGR